MWRLKMTDPTRKWIDAGDFDTVTAAAQRIREIEEYPVTGVFLHIYVDAVLGSDDESFGHLEHTGKRALYVIKCQVN